MNKSGKIKKKGNNFLWGKSGMMKGLTHFHYSYSEQNKEQKCGKHQYEQIGKNKKIGRKD